MVLCIKMATLCHLSNSNAHRIITQPLISTDTCKSKIMKKKNISNLEEMHPHNSLDTVSKFDPQYNCTSTDVGTWAGVVEIDDELWEKSLQSNIIIWYSSKQYTSCTSLKTDCIRFFLTCHIFVTGIKEMNTSHGKSSVEAVCHVLLWVAHDMFQ